MDLRIIRKSDHSTMPWKNGLGSTSQIDIVPMGTSFPDGDFLWRLSSAGVRASGPFSLFPDFDRWLVVLSGQGLLLNGKTLGPYTPIKFAGEDPIHAELLQDGVVDLGLMYRRDKIQAKMKVIPMADMASEKLSLGAGCAYVYCVSGKVSCGNQALSPGECCYLEGSDLKIFCKDSRTLLVIIEIQKIS